EKLHDGLEHLARDYKNPEQEPTYQQFKKAQRDLNKRIDDRHNELGKEVAEKLRVRMQSEHEKAGRQIQSEVASLTKLRQSLVEEVDRLTKEVLKKGVSSC